MGWELVSSADGVGWGRAAGADGMGWERVELGGLMGGVIIGSCERRLFVPMAFMPGCQMMSGVASGHLILITFPRDDQNTNDVGPQGALDT